MKITIYIYIYTSVYTYVCMCIYIYIYIWRERERERKTVPATTETINKPRTETITKRPKHGLSLDAFLKYVFSCILLL